MVLLLSQFGKTRWPPWLFFYCILPIDFLSQSSNIPTVMPLFPFSGNAPFLQISSEKKIKENDLALPRHFSTLSTYSLLHRKQKLTFKNFEDGCHEATSCVGIAAQVLLVDRVSVITVAVIHILNTFCKVCTRPCLRVLLLLSLLSQYVVFIRGHFEIKLMLWK